MMPFQVQYLFLLLSVLCQVPVGDAFSPGSTVIQFFTARQRSMVVRVGDDVPSPASVAAAWPSVYPMVSITTRCGRSRLAMAKKGDGKQRRKKKSEIEGSSSSSSSSSAAAPNPSPPAPMAPRVSTAINIPIRRQIQYGRMNKQFRQSGSSSFRQSSSSSSSTVLPRTKYRRTWDEDEIEQKAEERRRKGQDPDWDVVLNQTAAAPLVIVDGYNIIHQWSRLKKHMIKGDTARARQLLVDDLENLQSIKGWRIEVVFDGMGRHSRGGGTLGEASSSRPRLTAADKATNKEVSKYGVRTVYTGAGIEADSYIEARCAEAKNITNGAKTGTFIVATDDVMIRLAGENAGALCMGAERFVNELKAVKRTVAHRVEAAMAMVNGHAMRPEKLWGTKIFTPVVTSRPTTTTTSTSLAAKKSSNGVGGGADEKKSQTEAPVQGAQETEDGRFIYKGRFGRGNLIIEDKRKKKKKGGESQL